MELVLFWLGLAVVVAVAANTRGRSGGGWFLLAIVISPLLAGLLVLALPRLNAPKPEPMLSGSATKVCPECAERVQAAARICRFCRHEFGPAQLPVAEAAPEPARQAWPWQGS